MSGYEFDSGDKNGSLRDRFDYYCKEVIYHAAHNLVCKQTQYLRHQFGEGEVDPDMLMQLQARKREILLMNYMLDMTLDEIAGELGLEYETIKSTKSKAIREIRKGAAGKDEKA